MNVTAYVIAGFTFIYAVQQMFLDFHTWKPVYRGLIRMERTANLFQAIPLRWRLRSGSWADGLGMPSRVSPSAMA